MFGIIKIKIVRREMFHDGCYYTCYDVYHGFTGFPSTWPFKTKWVVDKVGLTELQLRQYMTFYLTTVGKVKIVVKAKMIRKERKRNQKSL